jgi:thiamine biosynthesis lipoprotein
VRSDRGGEAERAADRVRSGLLDAHDRLSRFREDSELSLLNRDPRATVPASRLLRRLANAVKMAAVLSGGLVDGTLLGEIEQAGYRDSIEDAGRTTADGNEVPARLARARPRSTKPWGKIRVDEAAGTIGRPPGLGIDSGGLAKGLLADLAASALADQRAYAVDCCGDIRIGGASRLSRAVLVGDPYGEAPIHKLSIRSGATATTGITRRRWIGPDGAAAHHLLDPRSGRPAFTGVAQVTAVAPTGLIAETYAKAALLSGPDEAAQWLPHGGVIVLDGGAVETVAPRRPLAERAGQP